MKRSSAVHLNPELAHDADARSKSMIRIGQGGRPFLDYLLFNVEQAGYKDVVIVIGEGDTPIREQYGMQDHGNIFHGLMISYAVQRIPEGRMKPLGTADAVLVGLRSRTDWEQQRVTVCNSDNLYSVRALSLLLSSTAECSMIDYDRSGLGFPPDRAERYAVLEKNGDGALADIIEKPTVADIERCSDAHGRVGVSMNIFRFRSSLIIPALEATPLNAARQERELPAAVSLMIKNNPGCLVTVPLAEQVPDLTAREDIPLVMEFLAKNYGDPPWSQPQ